MSLPIHTIESPKELIELVRHCGDTGRPIVDYGVAHAGLGHAPPDSVVKIKQVGGMIEHEARDLVVRAAGGASVGQVQRALAQTNQWLALDADDDLTISEIIAHNVYGPLRAGYGALRDMLLGLGFIDGAGRDIRVGGRTVKNVAGYDVSRFMIGNLGELGVIHEATLRTQARPESAGYVCITLDDPAKWSRSLTALLVTDAAPAWLNMALDGGAWRAHFGFHGSTRQYEAQQRALQTWINANGGGKQLEQTIETFDQDQARRRNQWRWRRSAEALVKVITPPAKTGAVCVHLKESTERRIEASPIHGCIWVGGDLNATSTQQLDQSIMTIIKQVGGFRAWYAKPDGAEHIAPFAPKQSDEALLANIKQKMDPKNLLNPGRYLSTTREAVCT